MMITIGLIGDYNAAVTAHQAVPKTFSLTGEQLAIGVGFKRGPTGTCGA
jgi:hypothetical protein